MLTAEQLTELKREPLTAPNKLRRARELAGLTQVALSEGADISQPYLSAIETGRAVDLPLETVRRLAQFFGCAIEDLFPSREQVAS